MKLKVKRIILFVVCEFAQNKFELNTEEGRKTLEELKHIQNVFTGEQEKQ
jgi:hypothetical protein